MNMNTHTSNPFQVPSCLQRADSQLRRRERFRRGVVVAVAAVVALLVVLLIEGCMSEHARTASGVTTPSPVAAQTETVAPATVPAAPEVKQVAAPAQAPVSTPATTPVTTPKLPTPGVARPQMLYVVKPGDTLGHIARANHTSVKALKDVNSLTSDMISVGAKLKLPSA